MIGLVSLRSASRVFRSLPLVSPTLRCLHTDPHHKHGLFWHELGQAPNDDRQLYALSFLRDPPKSPYSITNIGLVRGDVLNEKTFEPASEWMSLGQCLPLFTHNEPVSHFHWGENSACCFRVITVRTVQVAS